MATRNVTIIPHQTIQINADSSFEAPIVDGMIVPAYRNPPAKNIPLSKLNENKADEVLSRNIEMPPKGANQPVTKQSTKTSFVQNYGELR